MLQVIIRPKRTNESSYMQKYEKKLNLIQIEEKKEK